MKFATLRSDTRDGELCLVNKQMTHYVKVTHIAKTLQEALDRWDSVYEDLCKESIRLNNESSLYPVYSEELSLAPLPRAYQFLDASAYVHHVELARKSRGVDIPESFWKEPLMYQGVSDYFLSSRESIPKEFTKYGLDFESEIAVITDYVPRGTPAKKCLHHVKLLMLINDISLREIIRPELSKGFGFLQSKPQNSCSPVAVTPDELGEAWQNGKVHLPLMSYLNGSLFGKPNAGIDMVFDFSQLIAHACSTRSLCPGSIIASGTVSNKDQTVGNCCIVEQRMLQQQKGQELMCYLKLNDFITIKMEDTHGYSIFGSIQQKVQ